MKTILYCSVCGHALNIESKGKNKVCQYAFVIPCEVCAAQPLRAVDAAMPPSAEPLSGLNIVPAVEFDTQPRP